MHSYFGAYMKKKRDTRSSQSLAYAPAQSFKLCRKAHARGMNPAMAKMLFRLEEIGSLQVERIVRTTVVAKAILVAQAEANGVRTGVHTD